ncbi:unnamed protein product [Bursaphelenchus xylophilus]|nr:unnamed protein product [Bursaphelenchus xylophilus]CAG9094241.1 unnamed protein product [Bursaphelenchus xylophilus]
MKSTVFLLCSLSTVSALLVWNESRTVDILRRGHQLYKKSDLGHLFKYGIVEDKFNELFFKGIQTSKQLSLQYSLENLHDDIGEAILSVTDDFENPDFLKLRNAILIERTVAASASLSETAVIPLDLLLVVFEGMYRGPESRYQEVAHLLTAVASAQQKNLGYARQNIVRLVVNVLELGQKLEFNPINVIYNLFGFLLDEKKESVVELENQMILSDKIAAIRAALREHGAADKQLDPVLRNLEELINKKLEQVQTYEYIVVDREGAVASRIYEDSHPHGAYIEKDEFLDIYRAARDTVVSLSRRFPLLKYMAAKDSQLILAMPKKDASSSEDFNYYVEKFLRNQRSAAVVQGASPLEVLPLDLEIAAFSMINMNNNTFYGQVTNQVNAIINERHLMCKIPRTILIDSVLKLLKIGQSVKFNPNPLIEDAFKFAVKQRKSVTTKKNQKILGKKLRAIKDALKKRGLSKEAEKALGNINILCGEPEGDRR